LAFKEAPSLLDVAKEHAAEAVVAGAEGLRDGDIIVADQLTFGMFDSLHEESEKLIAENGGLYSWSATSGVIAREALLWATGGKIISGGLGLLGSAARLIGLSPNLISKTSFIFRNGFALASPYFISQGIEGAYKDFKEADQNFSEGKNAEGVSKGVSGLSLAIGSVLGIKQAAQDGINAIRGGPKAWQEAWRNSCFVAGTPVRTPIGSVPIEQLQVGDWVLSRNEHDPDGPVRAKRVVRTFIFRGPVVVLHANTRLIETTPEHPFYVEGKGWQTALELQPGDRLTTSTEETVICSGCALSGRVEAVYNVEVEEDHTYFIGENDWGWDLWAHNATAGRGGAPTPSLEGAPRAVEDSNRGVTWTTERTGRNSNAKAWEDSATGASSDVATQRRNVPALRYNNPNPAGDNMVRFDAIDPKDPKILIDRKWGVTTKTDQVDKFKSGPLKALEQNPDFRLRIEVPDKRAATDARRLLRYATGFDTHPQIDIVVTPPLN
jgi:hypothetical protein